MNHNTNDQGLLQEIEEDLQRQKFEALWRRFGPSIVGVALAIVVATAAISGWKAYTTSEHQKSTQAFFQILDKKTEKPEEKIAQLADFAKQYSGKGVGILAAFEAAGSAAAANNQAKAIEILDTISADSKVEPFFRDMATLLSVQYQMDKGDPAALEAKLQPLMDKSEWKASAIEFAANLAVKAGDKEKARQLFLKIVAMPDAPKDLSKRAEDMLQWLNGGA